MKVTDNRLGVGTVHVCTYFIMQKQGWKPKLEYGALIIHLAEPVGTMLTCKQCIPVGRNHTAASNYSACLRCGGGYPAQ